MAFLGLIGLGLVGSELAQRFLAAGHDVFGFDLKPELGEQLSRVGGEPCFSSKEVVEACDICFLSLPTSEIAEHVLRSLLPSLTGKTVVDTTTGEPATMAKLGRDLAAQGAAYLDATIVGSSKQVRAGEVLVLVGGMESAFQSMTKIFDCFARRSFYLGEAGSGARMKLVVNLVLGLHRAVLAEGLTFAKAYGVDPDLALEILRAGAAYSRVMDNKGPKMIQRDFSVEARLSQHHKDVLLILRAAADLGLELPLSRLHDQLLSAAESAGFGEADNSAIITAFDSF